MLLPSSVAAAAAAAVAAVAQAFNPSPPALSRQKQADVRGQGQLGLQSEFEDSQDSTEKPCLKKTNKIK